MTRSISLLACLAGCCAAATIVRRDGGGSHGAAVVAAGGSVELSNHSLPQKPLPIAEATNPSSSSTAGDVHCVFTVDCRPFNLWQVELLFSSAKGVAQQGPITAIVSGCSKDKEQHVMQRHLEQKWPVDFKLFFAPPLNDEKSHFLSKPYGVKAWYQKVGPERDVVAVLDPDFLFLRPLTADLDPSTAIQWEGEPPKRVKKGVVVAQRYGLASPDLATKDAHIPWRLSLTAEGMDNAALLAYVCTGSKTGKSSCGNVSQHEMGTYHSTGVPYIAHRADWDWLVNDWSDITVRLHEYSKPGYYVDMWSWVLANVNRGQRQLVLHNYMLTDVGGQQADWEVWDPIDAVHEDPCSDFWERSFAEQSSSAKAKLPHFIHYCQNQDSFSKYWFDWGKASGLHSLERCDEGNQSEGLRNLMKVVPVRNSMDIQADKKSPFKTMEEQHRSRFLGCTMRRSFKDALKQSCAGRPSAVFVSMPEAADKP